MNWTLSLLRKVLKEGLFSIKNCSQFSTTTLSVNECVCGFTWSKVALNKIYATIVYGYTFSCLHVKKFRSSSVYFVLLVYLYIYWSRLAAVIPRICVTISGDILKFGIMPRFRSIGQQFSCHLKHLAPRYLYRLSYETFIPGMNNFTLGKRVKEVMYRNFSDLLDGHREMDFLRMNHITGTNTV